MTFAGLRPQNKKALNGPYLSREFTLPKFSRPQVALYLDQQRRRRESR